MKQSPSATLAEFRGKPGRMGTYQTSVCKFLGFNTSEKWDVPRFRAFALFHLHIRACTAVLLAISLTATQVVGAAALGTVTSAFDARIGETPLSVGSSIFSGDQLRTENSGSLQIRLNAARFALTPASFAWFAEKDGIPVATLAQGTAVFSTANAKAFVLKSAKVEIRAKTDQPTVGQVNYVNEKELRVRCNRGSLAITFEGETQYIVEGMAYRVILDPDSYYAAMGAQTADPQRPRGAGTEKHKEPRKAGRSRFLLIAIIITSVATGVALYEAWLSPVDP